MKPFRKERIASIVRDVVAEALHHRLQDPRLASFTTVTRVEMSHDVQVANVFIGVRDEAAEKRTLAAVRHAGGYIQRMVAQALSIRQCPELRFEVDEQAKRVQRTLQLLEDVRRAKPEVFETPVTDETDDESEEDASPPEAAEGGPTQ